MVKIEIEHRGKLTEKKLQELRSFFDEKGNFIEKKERFSIIYSQNKEEGSNDLCHSPIDLKLRITNKKPELVLKHGNWSGNDARKEFLFPVEPEKFEEMTEFLKILGHYHGVLQATVTYLYNYKGVDFSLVEVPGWGYYFEAEIITDEEEVDEANEKIKEVCDELSLKVLDHNGFCELLKSLNDRPGFRFNFEKENFFEIKKRFQSYF